LIVPVAPFAGTLAEFEVVTWLPGSRAPYETPAGSTSAISSTLASKAEELDRTTV
jgi:hypothetical protein